MIPMGYGKSSLGTCFGVFIILGGVWLTTTLVKSGADMADARKYDVPSGDLSFSLFLLITGKELFQPVRSFV